MNLPEIIEFSKSEYVDLQDAVRRDFFIFLGAGFSKQAGFKLWDELIAATVKKFWDMKLNNLINGGDKLTWSIKEQLLNHNKLYAMDYLYSLDPDKFHEIVTEIFKENDKNIKSDIDDIITITKPLIKLGCCKFISTNIDRRFQEQCNIQESDVSINPSFSSDVKLNYLHGRIDKKTSWILTQSDYLQAYNDENSPIMKFLEQIFARYTVIFVGYGFSDYEILQAMGKARQNKRGINILKHFALVGVSASNDIEWEVNEDIFKNNFGITLLKYNIENKGYSLLKNNLECLVNMIVKINQPKTDGIGDQV